jgi:hypothetical protein
LIVKSWQVPTNTRIAAVLILLGCELLCTTGASAADGAIKEMRELGNKLTLAQACGVTAIRGSADNYSATLTLHEAILNSAHSSVGLKNDTASPRILTLAYIAGTELQGAPNAKACVKITKKWDKFDKKQAKTADHKRSEIDKVRARR